MNPWVAGLVAGIGASWVTDTSKLFVARPMSPKQKVGLFCATTASFFAVIVGFSGVPKASSYGAILGALLLSLGTGKVLHALTSFLQAAKDNQRIGVISAVRANTRKMS